MNANDISLTSAAHDTTHDEAQDATNNDVQAILEADLVCSICQEVYINPFIINCSHSFCKYCIYRWLKKKARCPNCRVGVVFKAENLALKNVINKMIRKASPQFQSSRSELIEHRLRDEERQENPSQNTPMSALIVLSSDDESSNRERSRSSPIDESSDHVRSMPSSSDESSDHEPISPIGQLYEEWDYSTPLNQLDSSTSSSYDPRDERPGLHVREFPPYRRRDENESHEDTDGSGDSDDDEDVEIEVSDDEVPSLRDNRHSGLSSDSDQSTDDQDDELEIHNEEERVDVQQPVSVSDSSSDDDHIGDSLLVRTRNGCRSYKRWCRRFYLEKERYPPYRPSREK